MEPRIIKQAQILTPDDFAELRIVDWNRWNYPRQASAAQNMPKWLISCWYTIIGYDLRNEPLREGFKWGHQGDAHHSTGHQYWSFFKRVFPDGEIEFADAPDFSGYFVTNGVRHEFMGDIDTISASAFFLDVVPRLNKGDLWITVHEQRQIIIEASYDINDVLHSRIEVLLEIDTPPVARLKAPETLRQMGLWS